MWGYFKGLQARRVIYVESIRAGLWTFFFFLQIGLGSDSFSFSSFIVSMYVQSTHRLLYEILLYWLYYTYYIHHLRNMQRIYVHISIQVIVDHVEHQGDVGAWRVTKSSQCFGKSCILDHPCIWRWSWLAVSSLDAHLERSASLGIL